MFLCSYVKINKRMKEKTKRRIEIVVWAVVYVFTMWITFSSCTTTKVVTVPEVHEIYHNQTDTVIKQDSVIRETQTTIMQLDSAAMAQYGIQLKAAERAWLVKSKELERQIERLMAMSATKDSVHDSIPYPVEVIKEVPRKVSKTERGLMIAGILSMMAVIVFVAFRIKKFLPLR